VLDQNALSLWFSMRLEEQQRSPAGPPLGPLRRLALALHAPATDVTTQANRDALRALLIAFRQPKQKKEKP
jgi:hypothetical protein